MTRPILTAKEQSEIVKVWPDSFLAGSVPTEEEVARSWADHYWFNRSTGFKTGNPVDALKVASGEKLIAIAMFFESAGYRSRHDRVS
jgi:hypothetical protein